MNSPSNLPNFTCCPFNSPTTFGLQYSLNNPNFCTRFILFMIGMYFSNKLFYFLHVLDSWRSFKPAIHIYNKKIFRYRLFQKRFYESRIGRFYSATQKKWLPDIESL